MTTIPVTTHDRIPTAMTMTARPAGPAAGGLTFGDVIRILRQRIFLVIFIFLLMTALTVGLTHWLIKNHPRYQAISSVRVESPFPPKPMEFGERMIAVELMNRFVGDQMFLVKDEGVLTESLNDTEVQSTSWYKEEPVKSDLLEDLKDNLDVRQAPDANFFLVSFGTKDPNDAPKIVNTIVRRYLAKVQSSSLQQYSDELGDYRKRQAELRRALQQIRDQKETFLSSQLGVPGMGMGVHVVGETWRALAVESARIEMEQLQLKAAWENLKGLDPSQVALSPQIMLMIDQDPQVAVLKNNKLQLQQDRLSLLQKVGPNHQSVQAIDAQIGSLQGLLDRVITEKQEQARQYQVNASETAYLNASQAKIQLQERVDAAKAEQRDADRKQAQYQTLDDEQQLLTQQYTQISDYINQLELVVLQQRTVRVQQISAAVKPLERSFPKWEINLPIGIILGIMLGCGLAMLLELVDTSVKTTRDIVRHVHIPILGMVPDLDDEELPIDRIELAAHSAPRSMIAEAFRTIRTNLLLSAPAERERTILVTSAKPEEGKTSVATNLAISIAQNNRKVLLIDANFHQPALRTVFPEISVEGLTNILIGQATLESVVVHTNVANLDVVGSGPIPPNPAELLASPYMQKMITEATDRYDQIIFDGPPILLVSDALVIAGMIDGVVLVCRAKAISRGVVQRAREQLERASIRIFGGVLNAAQVARGGYFREQIRTYYDYQPPAESLQTPGPRALPKDEQQT